MHFYRDVILSVVTLNEVKGEPEPKDPHEWNSCAFRLAKARPALH